MSEVTRLLDGIAAGDAQAGEQLIALVYAELRRMASNQMGRNSSGQTLQPTALVHEAWLRMGGENLRGWQNRAHFFGAAAATMRSILVDRARRGQAQRHGGGQVRVNLDDIDIADAKVSDQILAVHEVLEKFAVDHPEKAELVRLRYFAGLSAPEAAQVLEVSDATVHRWWAYARAWLGHEIKF